MGNNFEEHRPGTTLGSSFGQLSGTILRNTCFEKQQLSEIDLQGILGSNFSSNFGELLSGPLLGTIFDTSFGVEENSFGAASGTNFGKLISGTALGSNFVNNFLEQLWGAIMHGAIFDDVLWE